MAPGRKPASRRLTLCPEQIARIAPANAGAWRVFLRRRPWRISAFIPGAIRDCKRCDCFFKPQRCNRQGLAKTRNRAVSRFSLEMAGSWGRNIHQCPETPHAVSRMPLGLSAAAFMRPVFRSSVAAQRISYCHVSNKSRLHGALSDNASRRTCAPQLCCLHRPAFR